MKDDSPNLPDTKDRDEDKIEAQVHGDTQSRVLKEALGTANHSLDGLIALMREQGETEVHLCGPRLEGGLCLESNELGAAISVLPQDGEKASEPGFHPASTEVYIIFQGSLVVEFLKSGHLCTQNCRQFDVVVIPSGRCHRVRIEPEKEAAFLIVRTNLQYEPGVLRCDKCFYYGNPRRCPVHESWLREKNELSQGGRRKPTNVLQPAAHHRG